MRSEAQRASHLSCTMRVIAVAIYSKLGSADHAYSRQSQKTENQKAGQRYNDLAWQSGEVPRCEQATRPFVHESASSSPVASMGNLGSTTRPTAKE